MALVDTAPQGLQFAVLQGGVRMPIYQEEVVQPAPVVVPVAPAPAPYVAPVYVPKQDRN